MCEPAGGFPLTSVEFGSGPTRVGPRSAPRGEGEILQGPSGPEK